jgi:hypothetical protein
MPPDRRRDAGYARAMGYLLVLVAAIAAGVGVWAFTLRADRTPVSQEHAWSAPYVEPDQQAAAPEPTAPPEPPRRKPLPADPTWQTRVTGVMGLVIACVAAAALLVVGGYAVWTALSRAFGG